MDNIAALLIPFPQVLEIEDQVYLVGGAIRDTLLNRPVHDLDFSVQGDAHRAAKIIANAFGGAAYAMDEERDSARAMISIDGQSWVLDFTRFRGNDIEEDLRGRDFSANAMAVPVREPFTLIDPCGGLLDTKNHVLRACSEATFSDDPLRILRGIRLALSLGFKLESTTIGAMKNAACLLGKTSTERIRDELLLMMEGPTPTSALLLMDKLGVLPDVLPQLPPLKKLAQPEPHVYDAWEHTLKVVDNLGTLWDGLIAPYREDSANHLVAGLAVTQLGRYRKALQAHFNQSFSPGRSRKALLLLGATLHDIGKPDTRRIDGAGVHFFGHHDRAAELIQASPAFLALSNAEAEYLRLLVGGHMRIHFFARDLRKGTPLDRRMIYRFYKDLGDVGVDLVLLSLADTLATFGPSLPIERWQQDIHLSRLLLEAWFERSDEMVHPPRLLDGTDLMAELDISPGPQVGRLLASIEEAQAIGDIKSYQEAMLLARRLLKNERTGM